VASKPGAIPTMVGWAGPVIFAVPEDGVLVMALGEALKNAIPATESNNAPRTSETTRITVRFFDFAGSGVW